MHTTFSMVLPCASTWCSSVVYCLSSMIAGRGGKGTSGLARRIEPRVRERKGGLKEDISRWWVGHFARKIWQPLTTVLQCAGAVGWKNATDVAFVVTEMMEGSQPFISGTPDTFRLSLVFDEEIAQ